MTRAQMIAARVRKALAAEFAADDAEMRRHIGERLHLAESALTAEGETPAALVALVREWQAARHRLSCELSAIDGLPEPKFYEDCNRAADAVCAWTPAPGEAERARDAAALCEQVMEVVVDEVGYPSEAWFQPMEEWRQGVRARVFSAITAWAGANTAERAKPPKGT